MNLQNLKVSWNNIPELDYHHCCFQEIYNTQSHGIELVLLWNAKVLSNLLKLIIPHTVVSFSTTIFTFWAWICYEAWRLVTKMPWNHLVVSSQVKLFFIGCPKCATSRMFRMWHCLHFIKLDACNFLWFTDYIDDYLLQSEILFSYYHCGSSFHNLWYQL